MNEIRASSSVADPCGFWHTGLDAAGAAAAARDFAELCCDGRHLVWVEFRPGDGRCLAVLHDEAGARVLTPAGYSVRSRVHEYGGGAICLADGDLVFVNESDQQLYWQALAPGSELRALCRRAHCRYGGLVFDARRRRVIAVEEQHDGRDCRHRLVAIGLDGWRQVLAEGSDFYGGAAISPDGGTLAWVEWDRPHQPWVHTRLCRARLTEGGHCHGRTDFSTLAQESWQQPRFAPDGGLFCLVDRDNWWRPWQVLADGRLARVASPAADHAPAPWQLGGSHYLALAGGELALSWLDEGYGHLALQHADGTRRALATGYTRFRALAADAGYLYCIAGSPECTAAVLALSRRDGSLRVLAESPPPLPAAEVSRPQRLLFATGAAAAGGREVAHGFFYPPHQAGRVPAAGELPPLLVFTHGGPTSASYPVLDPRIQFWTQRGFAVADINYRGSTGYGRAYRQRLKGGWGVVDVEDILAAVDHLAMTRRVDGERVFMRGQSAGGYTTLSALVGSRRFLAAASLYGVSDPQRLRLVTHKFEADYIDWLIGDPVLSPALYQERSPLQQAGRMETPLVFFQGLQDAVVLPAQTDAMVRALQAAGREVECHRFADERHGFRQAANQRQVLEAELAFYRRFLKRALR